MLKKVSVIIPTYNRKDLLIACIDSILKQKYNDLEIIVIDNGSTDGTCELLNKKYLANSLRLELLLQHYS